LGLYKIGTRKTNMRKGMIFRRLVGSLTGSLGYELRRVTRDSITINALNTFHDQQVLLSDIPVQTIFDVGAHIGVITAEYRRFFPKATIYSFEPLPVAFEELCTRFKDDGLVRPIPLAVSNKAGKRMFFVNQDNTTISLLPAADETKYWVNPPDAIKSIATIEVPVTAIDDFCKQESVNEIEILKMDIQGGELMALEGATGKLSQGAILLIYTEVPFVPIYTGQALFYEIYDFLSRYGYTLFGMYNVHCSEGGRVKWGDAVFVSPQIRRRL